jgi:hypothetical protein
MNSIEHYAAEKKKLKQVRKRAAAERQARLDSVRAYFKSQEAGGVSRDQILKHYFEKYKDILDNQLTASMKTKERIDLLKETVYKHEILHEDEENMGVKKAA